MWSQSNINRGSARNSLSRTAGEGGERSEPGEGASAGTHPHPPIASRWVPPSPAMRERGYGCGLRSPLDQRAFVAAGALEGLIAGDRGDLLEVVPRPLRLGRLLDLE